MSTNLPSGDTEAPKNGRLEKAAKRVAKVLGKLEDALEDGDLEKAEERCATLHGLLDRYLVKFGPEMGLEPRSVVPKDPQ